MRALWVKDDVLGAEGLVGAWQGVVGSSVQSLCHIAVRFGLSAQELTSSFPEQLGEFIFGRRLKGAQEEEETAIEEWWELQKMNGQKEEIQELVDISPTEYFCEHQKHG